MVLENAFGERMRGRSAACRWFFPFPASLLPHVTIRSAPFGKLPCAGSLGRQQSTACRCRSLRVRVISDWLPKHASRPCFPRKCSSDLNLMGEFPNNHDESFRPMQCCYSPRLHILIEGLAAGVSELEGKELLLCDHL